MSVFLSSRNRKDIPVKFNGLVIDGYFVCSHSGLTSLQNSPKEVLGYFSCSYNFNLTSLKHCPKKIQFAFICYDCSFFSIDGLPIYSINLGII